FSDYECPYCAQYSTGVGQQIDKQLVANGKVQYAFVNNPLPMHSSAKLLAAAAICAGEEGKYWPMHDRLFESTPRTKEGLLPLIDELGLDSQKFKKCLEEGPNSAKQIDDDSNEAKKLGLVSTPSFAVGHLDRQGHVNIDKFIS